MPFIGVGLVEVAVVSSGFVTRKKRRNGTPYSLDVSFTRMAARGTFLRPQLVPVCSCYVNLPRPFVQTFLGGSERVRRQPIVRQSIHQCVLLCVTDVLLCPDEERGDGSSAFVGDD